MAPTAGAARQATPASAGCRPPSSRTSPLLWCAPCTRLRRRFAPRNDARFVIASEARQSRRSPEIPPQVAADAIERMAGRRRGEGGAGDLLAGGDIDARRFDDDLARD